MPSALITGASGGIGLELARVFAREGYSLVLVARSRDRLDQIAAELKPTPVQVIAKDLTLAGAAEEILREVPQVDVLVNNAGFGVYGPFARMPLEEDLGMLQLNMTVLVELTKLYLPGMLAAKSGKILNVASTAAFQPGPLMALYYATKAFVLSFSEAIANELEGTGVTVTALCPGPTATGFQARTKLEKSRLFKRMKVMDARPVAEMGYRALMSGKALAIPGMMNKVLVQSVRFSPRSMVTKIARMMQEEEVKPGRSVGSSRNIVIIPNYSDSCHPTFRFNARLPGFCTAGRQATVRPWPAWPLWLTKTCTPLPLVTCAAKMPATLCRLPDWSTSYICAWRKCAAWN